MGWLSCQLVKRASGHSLAASPWAGFGFDYLIEVSYGTCAFSNQAAIVDTQFPVFRHRAIWRTIYREKRFAGFALMAQIFAPSGEKEKPVPEPVRRNSTAGGWSVWTFRQSLRSANPRWLKIVRLPPRHPNCCGSIDEKIL